MDILNKENHMLEDINYNKKILEKLSKVLTTDENSILLKINNKSIFINNIIKSQKMVKLSPKNIRIN